MIQKMDIDFFEGIPFNVERLRERKPTAELREAMEDARLRRNLYGPFATAEDAVRSMLEDDDCYEITAM